MNSITHDPQAVLDYAVDWTAWPLQAGETITASSWTITGDATQTTPPPSFTDSKATIWVTGGTVGSVVKLTNHITTSQGRQDDRTVSLFVSER